MGVGHAGGVSGNSKYAGAAATPSTHARMHAYARDRMSSGTEATTMNRGGQAGGWRRSSLRCRRRARGGQGRSGSSESLTAAGDADGRRRVRWWRRGALLLDLLYEDDVEDDDGAVGHCLTARGRRWLCGRVRPWRRGSTARCGCESERRRGESGR